MKKYKKILSAVLAMVLALSVVPADVRAAELTNLALGKNATANASEVASLGANNAVDGDTSSKSSRWSSAEANGPHWVAVDLGEEKTFESVRIFWEMRKANKYSIQISNDGTTYTDAKVINGRPSALEDIIVMDEPVTARYVRLYIESFTAEDPDGGVTWNTVSIYEMEIYDGVYEKPVAPVDALSVTTPEKGDKKLKVNIPESDKFTITYNGTDYEQVIGDDLTIYEPIVDTTVKVSFKTVNNADESDYEFKEFEVTVPGKYAQEEGDNAAPAVLPELREWKGYTGDFTIAEEAKVVIAGEELREVAEIFAADYEDLSGKAMEVVAGTVKDAKEGQFFFELTDDESMGLDEEGYLMEIKDVVTVTAEDATGAMWATRTILQALKASDMTTIPQGITRDYPLYEVRGLILDVGRKTFTMDYLQQVVKQMSWFKLNDFHVHLNDNYIFLENYTNTGRNPMTAYSGFRLESGIKAGEKVTLNGKEFTYSADLTNTDVFYTKDEFRSFIKESDAYGVNIVPEFDAPAHSLSFTKVLPELRTGTTGRENDHLDLAKQYDECFDFITNIFDEYLLGNDPVFSQDTVVHIGADEYTAAPNKFREFCNDMADYVESTGRTARVWGSLSTIRGDGSVKVDGTGIQMNLWNFGYANMDEMYELGFDLIDCNDGQYYIVPNAGYYYDYLNASIMYNDAPNSISNVTIPAGDKQMIGAAYAIWNDMIDEKDNGVSEYDIYERLVSGMGLFAAKMWGKGDLAMNEAQAIEAVMGDAPNTNFGYEVEVDENGKIAQWSIEEFAEFEGANTDIEYVDGAEALKLNGGSSYVQTNLETVGLGNDLRVKVKRTSESTEDQILFESPYGSIKAVQGTTGKVGITRENYDYSFNYELPFNEWVELEFKNEFEEVSLFVNGELVDTLGDGESIQGRPLLATCMLPVEYIGSTTNAFEGYVKEVKIGKNAEYVSTVTLDLTAAVAKAYLEQGNEDAKLTELINKAAEITAQFAPSEEEMVAAKAQIEEILAAADYEKADYSRVEAYLELIPSDLSAFTADSVAVLDSIVNKILYIMPENMQETVDAYEVALRNAINGLEVVVVAGDYYDNSKAKATASNYQSGEGPEKALDGDASTMWHCDWNDSTPPHWIQIEMDSVQAIEGFYYLPRQSGTNGIATNYTIEVSTDGTNFTEVTSGTWASDASAKEAKFDAVEAKFVRLNIKAGSGGFGCAAEVKVRLVPAAKDTTAIAAAIEEVKLLADKKEQFTEETWAAVETALAAAEAVVANEASTAKDVENAKAALLNAKTDLVLKKDETPVEKDEVTRLFGSGRYDTAYAVADALKAVLGVEKFEAVVIATGTNFADALAGSYLAVEKNVPILLTNGKDANVAQLHAYIAANVAEGGKVYVLGGEGAVPAAVDTIDGYDVIRLFGDSRYDTNLEILKEAGVKGDSIIVATGKTFADSLSASAAKLPILLVKPNAALSDAQKEILAGMKNIYIVGGEGAVSAVTQAELAAFGTVTRVFGDSRYDTSVEVAKAFCKDVDFAVVASGKNFPDGLCGGPLAAALNAPLVLTKDGSASAAAAYVAENSIASGYVLGGDGALADATVDEVFGVEK